MTLMDCDIKKHMLTSQGKFCFVFVVLARERERERGSNNAPSGRK